ncbi:4-hydroxybenzoate polyprenyltransferase [Prosthecobacter fusiformis]|uniref:4-hydroxybenzoate polyprenyltransferase n=1 Tax=Prosthecobacter fusiformis TaxID=48464 RepID=A0A4R7S389_9BACT|nr:UbiA family prenyltransferase [Prosthecobacter fusiformis]TDU72850.1 4-hydroxybenzoate polyprenyltransferase [Prosthecobacter fusiformis]
MLRPWLELARISNLPTVWTNVTAAWLLAGGAWLPVNAQLGWLLLAGSLLYTGGMILNDAADVQHDREQRKERPIPSGKVSLAAAWTVGLGMMLSGGLIGFLFTSASVPIIGALMLAILFYDLYHKPWPGAVWVMGACRVLLFCMAGSAVIPLLLDAQRTVLACPGYPQTLAMLAHMPPGVWIMGLTLGSYIVGLTMVARMEARGAVTIPLRALFAKGLLYAPALVALYFWLSRANWRLIPLLADFTPLAPLPFILIFIAMVFHATRLMRRGGPAIGRAVGILLAGIAVVDALAVMQVSLSLACGFVLTAPLLRLWQRWIAAT